jgi:hypothetical protein
MGIARITITRTETRLAGLIRFGCIIIFRIEWLMLETVSCRYADETIGREDFITEERSRTRDKLSGAHLEKVIQRKALGRLILLVFAQVNVIFISI